MGTGIAAAIPIVWGPYRDSWHNKVEKKYFTPTFFDSYNIDETGSVYMIKHELLLNNYLSFLEEFYDCIGENFEIGQFPKVGNFKDFREVFDPEIRNHTVPYYDRQGSFFSMLGGECREFWIFYSGSYKAFLEVYSTLKHFERILARAMKNPLANAVKFGIYG